MYLLVFINNFFHFLDITVEIKHFKSIDINWIVMRIAWKDTGAVTVAAKVEHTSEVGSMDPDIDMDVSGEAYG